jgi:hypothetical protein
LFRAKKRLEHPGARGLVHAATVVFHGDLQPAQRGILAGQGDAFGRAHPHRPRSVERFAGVAQEMFEGAPHLLGVERQGGIGRAESALDPDIVGPLGRRPHEQVGDERMHVDRHQEGLMLVGVKHQLPHDVGAAAAGLDDRVAVGADLRVVGRALPQQARVAENDGEEIVEIVGDAAGKGPQAFQPLRLAQAGVELPAFPLVDERDEGMRHRPRPATLPR